MMEERRGEERKEMKLKRRVHAEEVIKKNNRNNNTESDRPDVESKHEHKLAFANAF